MTLPCREREQREIVAVHAVSEVEDVGKACPGGRLFGPRSIGALPVQQKTQAAPHGGGIAISRGEQPQQRPRGLRGTTRRRDEMIALVAGAAFAPAAVGILN